MDPGQYIQQCAQEDLTPNDCSPRPPQVFNTSTSLIHGCAAPGSHETNNLSRCSACKVVQYCSRRHQLADCAAHRSMCNKVKKATANLDKEERILKRQRDDDIFEASGCRFCYIPDTVEYMRARFTLAQGLLKINTALAVTSALEHLLAMLELCRSDIMRLRNDVPYLYLRLRRDQEAYDFCTWWATADREAKYDFWNFKLPFQDTKNADAFGDIEIFDRCLLLHKAAITLLKIRMLIDLLALQRAYDEAGPHVPREIFDEIQRHTASSIIMSNPSIAEREDLTPLIDSLRRQVKSLYEAVKMENRYFWPALLQPGEYLTATVPQFSQTQNTLQYCYNAWAETPGAIWVIRELSKP